MSPQNANFDEFLNYASFAYNTSVHFTTNESPYFLMFGRDPIFSIDLALDNRIKEPLVYSDESDFKHRLVSSLQSAWAAANEATEIQRANMKQRYDRTARIPTIRVGDKVLLRNYIPQPNLSKKHQQSWRGIFRVLEIDGIYVSIKSIKAPQSNPFRVHINQLKRYFEQDGPAATDAQVKDDIRIALDAANATELVDTPGHTHTRSASLDTDTEPQIEVEPAPQKHKYNLRQNIQHAFVSTENRTSARRNT
jgi:hypothetical protein